MNLHKFRMKTMTSTFNEASHFDEGGWHSDDGEKHFVNLLQRFI